MYYLVGSTINLFFEDEVANLSALNKNILCGAITGGIYKSTLGLECFIYIWLGIVPFFVGAAVGGTMIGGFTLLVD